jgi:hypothetical protein
MAASTIVSCASSWCESVVTCADVPRGLANHFAGLVRCRRPGRSARRDRVIVTGRSAISPKNESMTSSLCATRPNHAVAVGRPFRRRSHDLDTPCRERAGFSDDRRPTTDRRVIGQIRTSVSRR